MNDWQAELELATATADEAGRLILRHYAELIALDWAPGDISTTTDRESQELIISMIRARFPDDGICAEESTPGKFKAPANSERIWVIDPIDGTRGFAVKNGEFAVMIGLVFHGEVVLGVVEEPVVERVTWAARGYGCFSRRAPSKAVRCRVTPTVELGRCVASVSRSQSAESARDMQWAFGLGRTTATYSAGIKLGQVARGETDLYLGDYLGLKDWDVCAGHILVEESGGNVTTIDGASIQYDGSGGSLKRRGILASNGCCHAAALSVLTSGGYSPE